MNARQANGLAMDSTGVEESVLGLRSGSLTRTYCRGHVLRLLLGGKLCEETQMQASIASMYGEWQAVGGVLAGRPLADEIVSATKLILTEKEYKVDLAGTLDTGVYTLEHAGAAIRIRIEGIEGPNAGKTYLALVEFAGEDEMRIAYDLSGLGYPQSMTPTTSPTNYVAAFVRLGSPGA